MTTDTTRYSPLASAAIGPASPTLPQYLLAAAASPGGGKVTLVIGAGCSFEPPTSIPLSRTCSEESHARLVADQALAHGACADPTDLSSLADAVFAATGSQAALVDQLRTHYSLGAATPNEGHKLAAALLMEGVVSAALTLNFDLALSAAVASLGAGGVVGLINGRDDLGHRKNQNVFYLHGNAHALDPDQWVLRTQALASEWQGTWQQVVAQIVLAAPVVVFAGLGTPAAVLVQSATNIKSAIPGAGNACQVDVVDSSQSVFFSALGLGQGDYVRAGWCDFMDALSGRVVVEHLSRIAAAAATLVATEGYAAESLGPMLEHIKSVGLIGLGSLRANWLASGERPYLADETLARPLVADLLLCAGLIARTQGLEALPCEDGVVDFCRGGQVVCSLIFVSGGGVRTARTVEAQLRSSRRKYRTRSIRPTRVVLAGSAAESAAPSPPLDIVNGDRDNSIISGSAELRTFTAAALRASAALCSEVVA